MGNGTQPNVYSSVGAMSALGQRQTLRLHDLMSALPPKADIPGSDQHVCLVPIADILLFIPSPRRLGRAVQRNADCCGLVMGQLMRGGLPFLDFVVFG